MNVVCTAENLVSTGTVLEIYILLTQPIVVIIIIVIISFMQGIYTYIPEKKQCH
jgi:hypothetical protein